VITTLTLHRSAAAPRFDLADGKQILIHSAEVRSPGSSRCRTVRPFRSWADPAVA
jgi:hypothetical protein